MPTKHEMEKIRINFLMIHSLLYAQVIAKYLTENTIQAKFFRKLLVQNFGEMIGKW